MSSFIRRLSFFILVGLGLLTPLHSQAQTSIRLLVLYPQISPAYELIFKEIISGIKTHPETDYIAISINKQTTHEEIDQKLIDNNIDAIISLGKYTYNFTSHFKEQIPVIHGGLLIKPNGHSGISLAGNPEQFFSYLDDIAPNVKRVFTVYNEANNGWIISLAKQAAAERNIELIAYPAKELREAVFQFKDVLSKANSANDAIWLLLDNKVPDKTVLPLALEAAWKKRIIVFSSNPSHTKRGALFALFPNHKEMGFSLAKLALAQLNTKTRRSIVLPLNSLKISLNKRTASHLGLRYSKDLEARLDIIYPLRWHE